MKRIAVLLPDNTDIVGARYKYIKLLKQISTLGIFFHSEWKRSRKFRPEFYVVFGSFWDSYKLPLKTGYPYVLCDHDISSLYSNTASGVMEGEANKVKNALRIIFTSPEHREYVCRTHRYEINNTMVLYLRNPKRDLQFTPLPKIEGKNAVYAGGLLDEKRKNSRFSYRCYIDIFKEFMKHGWSIYLYPARRQPMEYVEAGCIMLNKLNEGKSLYTQLSQYQIGLQIFNTVDTPEKSLIYSKMCRPNKLWSYLAGGIPTVGFNGGNGSQLYDGKWGITLNNISEIPTIEERVKILDIGKYRKAEVIESQLEEVRKFLEI